jgi:SpoVK/Ycf46/Vps4 family AAA+-type ATPase
MQDVRDLAMLIESKVPLIVLETHDELRALEMLTRLAMKRTMGFFTWSVTEGLNSLGFGAQTEVTDKTDSPEVVLNTIKQHTQPSIYALCDFHPFLLDEPKHVRLLKDIAINYELLQHTIILISHKLTIPPELKRYCAQFNLSLPDDAQLMSIIRDEVSGWSRANNNLRINTNRDVLKKLVKNLRGLSAHDAKRLARGIIRDDGAITAEDLPEINRLKFELMDMDGILSFEYDTEKFSAVGGLDKLKKWIKTRESAFLDGSAGDAKDGPKGVMLLGIQGSGKSLAAKAIAGLWGVPLLRFDMGALYNKYIGETEKNLRLSLKQADLMSPCVLWIDEIEKGLATGNSEDNTSRRVLGSLLTWMAERKSNVFLVATSNDVTSLPPELIRKGRLDEIFFVDLPRSDIREEILSIHLRKRDYDPETFDLKMLADQSEGFSGAELEQAVVAALYTATAQGDKISTDYIASEIDRTYPLSVVMSEKIDELRHWAEGRTVAAD